jgi:hypothetical protein
VVVSSDTDDPNISNNMAEAGVTAAPDTPVRAGITAPSFVPFGTRFSHHATVTNTSSLTAQLVRLCTRRPASLLQVQAPGTFRMRGLYCKDFASLGPGRTAGFTVSATPSRSGRVVVSDRATVAGLSRVSRAAAVVVVGPTSACPPAADAPVSSAFRSGTRSPPVARPAC